VAFVVDNSVVIAWFVGSQTTAYTNRLRERARREALHAPAVWPLEFVNTLWGLQRRRLLRANQVDEIIGKAVRLGVTVHGEPVGLASLLGLARQFTLSSYDASYLELAQRLSLPLATKDAPLIAAARRAGILLA
jgi:predicted nucleic acid-binding protein